MGLTPVARVRLGIAVGHERLTAAALNRMLDYKEPSTAPAKRDMVDAEEWETQ